MKAEIAQYAGWLKLLYFIVPIIILAVGYKLVLRVFGIIIIPEDSIGIVTKKFVLVGANKTLPDGTIVALNGEAGLQADTLPPGIHFWLFPWQFVVNQQKFTTIRPGMIGVVEARDGKPLADGRVLCKQVECGAFQDTRKFLQNGGERGPQITIIPPGTYRINTQMFTITEEKVTEIPDNMVGVVTTKEGKPLKSGDIAGEEIPGHNSFQDAQTFIDKGGYKGMQEQVILAGRYFINPRFATVETKDMSVVPIAHAGVIIAYVGKPGEDVTGEGFKHGNMVNRGEKGVQVEPLDPGKYPVNPLTHKVENVSTANIVLNWANEKSESHKLDENLNSIMVRTSDGYTFTLDVSQIIHIPRTDAPKVIAQFGSVANLVTQVLEPTIGNYFRNAAQGSDVIDFLKNRQMRQSEAKAAIFDVLKEYNVVAVDTLIGDITPPPELMKTLTDRKKAEQENITFGTQKNAEITRKELEQAKAMANTQAGVVTSERKVTTEGYEAEAAIKKAEGQAGAKLKNAEADAKVLELVGNATAVKIKATGTAEAEVIERKIQSMEAGNYAMVLVAEHLSKSRVPIVPEIMVCGGTSEEAGGGNSMVQVLMANLIRDNQAAKKEKDPKVQELEALKTETEEAAPVATEDTAASAIAAESVAPVAEKKEGDEEKIV